MKKIIILLLSCFFFCNIILAADARIGRNLFIDVYSNTEGNFKINYSTFKFGGKTKYGNLKQIVFQKIDLMETDNLKFQIPYLKNGKKINSNIELKFKNNEELISKTKILVYIGEKIIEKEDFELENLIIKYKDEIIIASNQDFEVKIIEKQDVLTEIIFANILGLKSYKTIFILGIIIFFIIFGLLIKKKDIISI